MPHYLPWNRRICIRLLPLSRSNAKKDDVRQNVDSKPNPKKKPVRKKTAMAKWRRQGREIAMQSLYQVDWGYLDAEDAIDLNWLERPAAQKAKLFASMLIKGTLEKQDDIDHLIKKYSQHWQFDRIPRIDLAILRFSLYSLLSLPQIPPIVTIDEAIEISKQYSSEEAWRYINGMLDAIYIGEIKKNMVKNADQADQSME